MPELHHTSGALYVVLRDGKTLLAGGRLWNAPWSANGYAIAEDALDRRYNVTHDYRIFRLIEVDRTGEPVV